MNCAPIAGHLFMSTLSKTADTLTFRCTLHFSDGDQVSGLIQTSNSDQDCPVLYAGAVDRLPYQFEIADRLLLRVLFRSFGRELDARFEEELTGETEANSNETPTGTEQFGHDTNREPARSTRGL